MNLKSVFTTLLLLTFFSSISFAQTALGIWKTIDDETGEARSHVEIYEKGGKVFGKIVKLLNPDTQTCDSCSGERKGKPLVGMDIMWDMKKKGKTWKSGEIFSPTKDQTYSCKIWLDDANTLKVRGYIAMFYRTQTWHRVQ